MQAAIERLGYSPNRAARSLRTRASHLIGLRVDPAVEDSANALMDRFVHSLVESTRETGYHVLLFSGDGDDDATDGYDELLRSAAVDAFVVTDTYRGNPHAAWLAQQGVPFVAFGRPWGEPTARHPWVDVDGRAGVVQAVDHLVERGHSRIAWVGWQKGSFIGEDRRSGWVDQMHARGLLDQPAVRPRRGHPGVRGAGRAGAARRGPAERPTAFVCASDTVAMGVLRTLDELGLRAGPGRRGGRLRRLDRRPGDPPGLTSVRQPLEEVAVEVVRYLASCSRTGRSPSLGSRADADAAGPRDQLAASVAAPPEVDRVVDLGALVAGERLVGDLARRARCARTPRGRRASRSASACPAGGAASRAGTRTRCTSSASIIG